LLNNANRASGTERGENVRSERHKEEKMKDMRRRKDIKLV
jgi:hypothetical protein